MQTLANNPQRAAGMRSVTPVTASMAPPAGRRHTLQRAYGTFASAFRSVAPARVAPLPRAQSRRYG